MFLIFRRKQIVLTLMSTKNVSDFEVFWEFDTISRQVLALIGRKVWFNSQILVL